MSKDKIFRQGDGKVVSYQELISIIANYVSADKNQEYEITIGTDSQSHADSTKFVEVIAARRIGKGGIFFYRTEWTKKVSSLRNKIYEETQRSLDNAYGFMDSVLNLISEGDISIEKLNIHFIIHCDIGNFGKTQSLIKEIVSWVHSMGYECQIKPESYTASGIANKFSK